MMTLYIVLSAIGGSGLTVALVNNWGKIKLKKMDNSLDEREQFVKELNDLRDQMNKLYKQHYQLIEENTTLKIKVKELEDHVNKKSLLLQELTKYRSFYDKLRDIVDNSNGVQPFTVFENITKLINTHELSSS